MSNNSSEPKYREFWIYDLDKPDLVTKAVHFMQRGFVPSESDIHVIEYSAYENMRLDKEHLELIKKNYFDEIQKLKDRLSEVDEIKVLKDINEQLKARLSEAEKVLSWMADRAVESHTAHSFVKRAQTYFDKYNK